MIVEILCAHLRFDRPQFIRLSRLSHTLDTPPRLPRHMQHEFDGGLGDLMIR